MMFFFLRPGCGIRRLAESSAQARMAALAAWYVEFEGDKISSATLATIVNVTASSDSWFSSAKLNASAAA